MSTSTNSTTNHTTTPWRVGRKGCVVADAPTSMPGSDDVHYYGGHMVAESVTEANAAFIVEACNAFDRLNGDRISLELQVARLKIDNANAQEDLSSARSNWEMAVKAGNDVMRQLEAAKLVQEQLVAALTMVRDADNDCANDGLPRIPAIARASIDAALAAAAGA